MKIQNGFEIKYASKINEAPILIIENLNNKFGITFECSNGKIINVTRERYINPINAKTIHWKRGE